MATNQGFDWVTARNSCTPHEIFLRLQTGAERDCATRQKQLDGKGVGFVVNAEPESRLFYVRRSGNKITDSVKISWTEAGISAQKEDGTVILSVTLTLNDEAECRLKVGAPSQEEIITFWQFRLRALENLFFNFVIS